MKRERGSVGGMGGMRQRRRNRREVHDLGQQWPVSSCLSPNLKGSEQGSCFLLNRFFY